MSAEDHSASRRNALLIALKACVAVTVGAILYPVARFLRPRPATQTGAAEVVAPYTVKDLKPDPKGAWPPPFDFGGKPCLVILNEKKEVKAFNAVCTHTECTVEFLPEKEVIFCACHNGVYNLEGRPISGPPPRPLEPYKVTLRDESGQEEIIVSREA